jgi:lipopolysaccharide export LptBFGC system permease protein LptF
VLVMLLPAAVAIPFFLRSRRPATRIVCGLVWGVTAALVVIFVMALAFRGGSAPANGVVPRMR